MKQLLLILSFIAMAFLAACSEGKTSIKPRTNAGFNKTIEQLDKASTDTSLEALKAQLEINENLQVTDVIATVRAKFGSPTVKPKPKTSDEDSKNGINKFPQKVTKQPEVLKESLLEMDTEDLMSLKIEDSDCNLKDITKIKEGSTETRSFYVKTCDIRVQVIKQFDSSGKAISVNAYVAARISKDGLEHLDSKDGEKTLESITANYSATDGAMILKFKIKSKTKNLDLESLPFSYVNGQDVSGEFKDTKGIYNGTFESRLLDGKKALILEFSSGDVVSTLLIGDLGLFGRNVSKDSKDATKAVGTGRSY